MRRWRLHAAIALVAIAALHYATVPRSIWEFDESLFAAAVERYEPLRHTPPPPGYPLYIGFAKIVALLTPDALTALLATSIIAVAAGFVAFVLAFAAIADLRTGVVAALLLYASPAMLISGTLPQSDAGALALLGFAVWGCAVAGSSQLAAHRSPWWIAFLCAVPAALCVGWRMQLSIAVVPMFLAALVMMRTWRERILAVGIFGVVCLTWFVPLVIATGGPASYWEWLSGQAAYYSQHDADLSRSGHSAAHIALRFIAHPWGPKWLSLPLLALAIAGVACVRRNRRALPLAIGSLTYLGFALATMDPADAVRYAIPSLPLIAFLAGSALAWLRKRNAGVPPAEQVASRRRSLVIATGDGSEDAPCSAGEDASVPLAGITLTFLYAIGATWYASPILRARATSISPPTAAIRWIEANVPRNAVVLYDAPLWPHASYLLRDWKTTRIDAGQARYGGDPAIPMVILADGERGGANGITFRWPDTDAYRKLTRDHYSAVSVIPLPPEQRFRVIEGVYAPERTRDGHSWRWIGSKAIIELPALGAASARLVFRTPPEYPLDENRIRVGDSIVTLKRNETAEVIVPLTDRITITPERTFVPANVRGSNTRDQRTLSVMLTHVEQIDPRPAAAEPPRRR